MQRLDQENKRLESEIQTFQLRQGVLREDSQNVKTTLSQTNDKISAVKFHILNLKQETEKLRTQIVKSPEKLKRV